MNMSRVDGWRQEARELFFREKLHTSLGEFRKKGRGGANKNGSYSGIKGGELYKFVGLLELPRRRELHQIRHHQLLPWVLRHRGPISRSLSTLCRRCGDYGCWVGGVAPLFIHSVSVDFQPPPRAR